MFDVTELEVDFLPARTTMVSNAVGGAGGNGGGLNVLSGIAVGVLNSGPVVASAGQGGAGGSAASLVG